MSDVVVIGGGHAGMAVAKRFVKAGLETTVIEQSCTCPDNCLPKWIEGRGVISGPGLVAVLDPKTGDERQVIPARAIVLAIGQLDPADPIASMLGITKFGVKLTPNGKTIETDQSGRTRADGIFATGGCASVSTPYVVEAVQAHCSLSAGEKIQTGQEA